MAAPNGQPQQNGPTNPASGIVNNTSTRLSGPRPVPLEPALADLLSQLEDYSPTIPDAVTQHYLATAGVQTDDPRIVKLVSLAAQKFISEIANDALQHCKLRGTLSGTQHAGKKGKDRKFTLTVDDLALALADQGITLKKPPYYV